MHPLWHSLMKEMRPTSSLCWTWRNCWYANSTKARRKKAQHTNLLQQRAGTYRKKVPTHRQKMLAIVYTIEHFRVYLAGGKFTVKPDNLPLVSIIKNSSAKLSASLERFSDCSTIFSMSNTHRGRTTLLTPCQGTHLK